MSPTVLATSVTSSLGFFLNASVLFLVLSQSRERYRYLFGGFLLVCALWDLGVVLAMLRNGYVNELPTYGYIIFWPCLFIPVLIYHFTRAYLNQPRKKTTILLWAVTLVLFVLGVSGLLGKIDGVHHYSWGNIFKPDSLLQIGALASVPIWYYCIWSSCWSLLGARRRETSPLKRRHLLYITISFFVISLALVKTLILYGIDNPFLLPVGMLFNDISGSLIGMAIIKYRLFDITIIVKKTTVYSALAALMVFVFSLSEHLLATYVGGIFGEQSILIHLASVAAVIGVVMPVRKRVESTIERFFARKRLEF